MGRRAPRCRHKEGEAPPDFIDAVRIGHLDVAFALGKPGHVVLELDIGIDDMSQDETQAGEAAEQGDCQDDQCEYLCGAGKGREQKARLRPWN